MSNGLLSRIYGAIIVKSITPPPHSHRCECMCAALYTSVCRIWKRTSHRGHFQNGEHAPGSEVGCKLRLLCLFLSCDFEAVLHNDVFCLTQTTPWCAPSPTRTLWSTPRWCPSTCRLLWLCWSTSASTSSSGWGGRGSPLARPAGRCSQAQLHRLWWGHHFTSFVSVFTFTEPWHHLLIRYPS